MPTLASAQLKKFKVSEMSRPDVSVVQGNTQFPDDALLFVYSSLKDLNFRSSLGAIDKVSYNPQANRYEILFKPNKQMLFVYASNFVEQKIETFNPNPKDIFYYEIEKKRTVDANIEPGTLKIITKPAGAEISLNGMRMADKTPFTGKLPPGTLKIKLQKGKHQTLDTVVALHGGETTLLSVRMKTTDLWVNINSTPSGATVSLDGVNHGITPANFELDLASPSKRGRKSLIVTLAGHHPVNDTIELWPSSTPLERKYSLEKQQGRFEITSTPEGAQVFRNGNYLGTTPFSGLLDVGNYWVKLVLKGYRDKEESFSVKNTGTEKLNIRLLTKKKNPVAKEKKKNSVPEDKRMKNSTVTTASGLKYIIWKKGEGAKAEKGDKVSVHYAGRLLDGSPFDDSYKRGKPFSFPLGGGRVIKGWDEGIAYMNVGDSATLIIPSELGYGAADRPTIPANSTLIFDVQLMDVKKVGKPVPYKVEGLETIATGTGLKYIRMNVTDGVQAKKGSTVSVHYTGYLEDGTIFDSSISRGEPISFPIGVGRVIKGWDEGISLLKVGEKARLLIPYQLAYGERGAGQMIKPRTDLIFDVELISVK